MARRDEGSISVIDITSIKDGDVVRFQDEQYLYQLHARQSEAGHIWWDAWRQDSQHPTLDNGQPLWESLPGRIALSGCYAHAHTRRFISGSGEEVYQTIPLEPALGKLMVGLRAWLVSTQVGDNSDYRSIQTGPIVALAVFGNKKRR